MQVDWCGPTGARTWTTAQAEARVELRQRVGRAAVQDAGDAEAGGAIQVVLDVVDHHAGLGRDAEALAGDRVDPPRRLGHRGIRGHSGDVGQRVEVEALVAVAANWLVTSATGIPAA